MRKLSESEEEHHLEEFMKMEGKVHSIDYDIWLDDKPASRKLKSIRLISTSEECSECGFFTMKLEDEEIEQAPTFQ
jgi:hypothetical protein